MAKKILVTGATGFVGSHLLQYLVTTPDEKELFGTYLTDNSLANIEEIKDKVNCIKVDLTQETEVFDLIEKIKPDVIYHLAAFPSAANSFSSPKEAVVNNVASQISIFEGMRRSNLVDTKTLVVSSAEVYGEVDEKDLPINESVGFRPTSPYAVSKLTQDFLGLQYFLSYKFKIIRVRPFNHIGPRQSPDFVVSSFAKKIAEIEKGKMDKVLKVGNLNSERDFTDVRDIVRAYVLAIDKGEPGDVYNLGSGKAYKISDILNKLLSMSKTEIKVEVDKALFRPSDSPRLVCDISKFEKLTGWKTEIDIDQTLKDTLDYWRNII